MDKSIVAISRNRFTVLVTVGFKYIEHFIARVRQMKNARKGKKNK